MAIVRSGERQWKETSFVSRSQGSRLDINTDQIILNETFL